MDSPSLKIREMEDLTKLKGLIFFFFFALLMEKICTHT